MSSILSLNSLTKKFGDKTAVDKLSFNVEQGDIFGFLGPNGAGKTTTLAMLLGIMKPSAGSFKIFDNDGCPPHMKKKIGALIESPAFYEYLTAKENLTLIANFYDNLSGSYLYGILETVGIKYAADIKVGKFSQGMKQRLWVAQALIGDPELLILDEPTNDLDPEGTRDIWQILTDLSKNKKATILISSHLLDEIETNCNKVCIINEGKMAACGYVSDLLQKYSSSVMIEIENAGQDKLDVFFMSHPELLIIYKTQLNKITSLNIQLSPNSSPANLNKELNSAGFEVRSFHLIKMTLREYFFEITSNSQERNKNNES
jgi:ABC-type multidrug transport system ATPase subunit